MTSLPCWFSDVLVPCDVYYTHFRSRTCFANHKQSTAKTKFVCEHKRCCGTCGVHMTRKNHECNKRYCENCRRNREASGHLCYMRPLKDALPPAGTGCCRYFTTLRPRKIRDSPTSPLYTYLNWFACNSFGRSTMVWKIVLTSCDAVIRWGVAIIPT